MSNAPEIQPMSIETKDKVSPIHNEQYEEDPIDHKKKGVNTQMDDAAAILAAAGERDYSLAERKRVLRRIDLFVCLPMCLVYLLQQLDKQTVSNAAVFDLRESTGLTGTEYPWLTSGVYVMQLVCQPLSSYALIVFPVKYWVMFNMISWSIVTACTAAATNFTGLIIARLLLGAFEATILPSFGELFTFLLAIPLTPSAHHTNVVDEARTILPHDRLPNRQLARGHLRPPPLLGGRPRTQQHPSLPSNLPFHGLSVTRYRSVGVVPHAQFAYYGQIPRPRRRPTHRARTDPREQYRYQEQYMEVGSMLGDLP